MYSKEALKNVKKDDVQAQLHLMFKCRCFYVFHIIKCPECGKSVISIHTDRDATGYRTYAYFICQHCGKRVKKLAVDLLDKQKAIKLKQYICQHFRYKGHKVDGLHLSDDKTIIVGKSKNLIIDRSEIVEPKWVDGVDYYK